MRLIFNIVSALFYLAAAWLWWRASPPPPAPEITMDGSIGRALEDWMSSSAAANRRAALCTGAAVLLQGVASIVR